MGYNLLMPISQFGVQIAHAISDYLTIDNLTMLDSSHSVDMAQQAIGTVASAITASYSYFWSRPVPAAPRPTLYATTPQQFQATGSGGGGKAGLERAMDLARLFGIVSSEEDLQYALSSQGSIGGVASRRSELITGAFCATNPENLLRNRITQEDCDKICTFVLNKTKYMPSRVAERLLEVIKKELNITAEMVLDEERVLKQGPIPIPTHEDEGFEIVQAQGFAHYDDGDTPEQLLNPADALLKVIYDEACELKITLRSDLISPMSPGGRGSPSNHSQGSRRSSIQNSSERIRYS